MKKIIIPVPKENSITIAEIQPRDNNLILCYKDNNPVGYFVHFNNDELWVFYNNNDIDAYQNIKISDTSLLYCIDKGIKDGVFDELKLIEFE